MPVSNKSVGDNMINIANLKSGIEEKVGQKVIIKGSRGRSKVFEKEATIEKAYPCFFRVKYADDSANKTESFKYADVLTRTIDVSVFDGEGYYSLVPPMPDIKKTRVV